MNSQKNKSSNGVKNNKFDKSLGELEAEIMEIIWASNGASVREVLNKLKNKRKIAYTTVMTVMGRLCDKDILKREINASGAYIYTSQQSREKFLASVSKKAINRLLKEFGNVAIAQFIDVMEDSDFKNSKEWQDKLKNIKQ